MATTDRRARDKETLRQKILDAARALFVSHGYDGVTLRKIAEAIEYAPGTIYSHFKDKDELMRALCVADWNAFNASLPRIETGSDPVIAIRLLGAAYIEFGLAHPHQYQFLFMSRKPELLYAKLDADTMAKKGDPARDGYALVRHTVQTAIDRKLLREELRDADLVAQTLWAGVHGITSLHIAMSNDTWIAWAPVLARAGQMLDALMHFLAHSRP